MARSEHELISRFFSAMTSGNLPDELLTPDMTAWTTTSGQSGKEKYQKGIAMLQSLFPEGLTYTVGSVTAEEDRAAAEVRSHGTLLNGDVFDNIYVFMFRIRDGRISSVAEHFNPAVVREKIVPLIQAAMSASPR